MCPGSAFFLGPQVRLMLSFSIVFGERFSLVGSLAILFFVFVFCTSRTGICRAATFFGSTYSFACKVATARRQRVHQSTHEKVRVKLVRCWFPHSSVVLCSNPACLPLFDNNSCRRFEFGTINIKSCFPCFVPGTCMLFSNHFFPGQLRVSVYCDDQPIRMYAATSVRSE